MGRRGREEKGGKASHNNAGGFEHGLVFL